MRVLLTLRSWNRIVFLVNCLEELYAILFFFLYFFNVSIDLFDWVSNVHNRFVRSQNCMCEVFCISSLFLSLSSSLRSFCVCPDLSLSFCAINTTSNNKSLHQVWYRLMRAHTRTRTVNGATRTRKMGITIENRISCSFDTHIVLYHFNWYCIESRGLLTMRDSVCVSVCA